MRPRQFLRAFMVLALFVAATMLRPVSAFAASNTTLTFLDDAIEETVAGSGYTIDGTALTIKSSGVYIVTGSCSEGSITVAKGTTDVTLFFDSLTLGSSTTAPVVVKKAADVTIHLEGTSTLSDNEDPANETSSDATLADAFEGACIKVKSGSTVTFCGEGDLVCAANAKNAIKGASTSALIFNQSGTITVRGSYSGSATSAGAINNGIACDGSIVINHGAFVIAAANDGIKSTPDATDVTEGTTIDTDSAGTITINGGTFDLDVDGDGIQADTALTINGGTFDIKTYKGYATWNDTLADAMSCKGLKASGDRAEEAGIEPSLTIAGGDFTLDCGDDAIHSDAHIVVTGGSFSIKTGDDGMHADTTLTLGTKGSTIARDPDVTIDASYEGLESGNLYLYSGHYHVVASDDGVNAAGGSSSGSDPGAGAGGFRPGAPGSGASDYNIYIYGGDLYVNCAGDGLDSNGGLYLYGGRQAVFSMAAGGDNSPIDADGTISIAGATLFVAGSAGADGRAQAGWFGSGQKYTSSTTSYNANTVLNAKAGSTVMLSYKLPRRVNYALVTWPTSVSSSAPSLASASSVAACKGGSWSHSWNNGTVTSEATATSTGTVTYTCSSCGATETRTTPMLVEIAECDHIEVDPYDITRAKVSADAQVYDGSAHEPEVTVVLRGVTLEAGADYTVAYADNVDPGTATVTVTGAGDYYGTASGTFKIDWPFCDVSSATPHCEDILWLFANGITTGWGSYPSCEYRGMNAILRQDMAAFLYRMAGSPDYTPSEEDMAYFSDVDESTPHCNEIWWLASTGISEGWTLEDGTHVFRPRNTVVRQDMAAFLYRLAGEPEFEASADDVAYFSDVDEDTPHCNEIWWLASTDISAGWTMDDGTVQFRGMNKVVRQDMAAFLHRLYGIYEG